MSGRIRGSVWRFQEGHDGLLHLFVPTQLLGIASGDISTVWHGLSQIVAPKDARFDFKLNRAAP